MQAFSEELVDYLYDYCVALGHNHINKDNVNSLLTKSFNYTTDFKDSINVLYSINGFLNKNYLKPYELFDWSIINSDIKERKLLDAIFEYELGYAEDDQILCIFESIILSFNLYQDKNIKEFLKIFYESIEFSIVMMFIFSLHGNISYFGYWADHILYENKSWIWTLLWNFNNEETEIQDYLNWEKRLFDLKALHDYWRFIEKIIVHSLGDDKILNFFYEFEIDKLIYHLLFGKIHDMNFINEEIKEITLINKETLDIIKALAVDNYIPDLSAIFQKLILLSDNKDNIGSTTFDNTFPLILNNFKPSKLLYYQKLMQNLLQQ